MDKSQMLLLVLAQVPTMILVLIGSVIHNRKLDELDRLMIRVENRMGSMENRVELHG
jgi:hypothetical protein